jgi:hypothetical protein
MTKKIIYNVLVLFFMLGFSFSSIAQKGFSTGSIAVWNSRDKGDLKKTSKSFTGGKKIVFEIEKAMLQIEAHSGSDVIFETYDYEEPPERAKGLKPLYNTAEDNTGIGLQVDIASGVMTVNKASTEDMDFVIKVPNSVAVQIKETGWGGDEFLLKDIKGEIEIEAKGSDIVIEGATGPVVANTTSGDITINFTSVNQSKPSSITNTSGFIDVTLPSSTKANLELKSVTGEIYTDMDIKFEKSEEQGNMRRVGGRNLQGTINGGGVEIALKTISDDIYLRKK